MPVIVTLDTGETYTLDRKYGTSEVAKRINDNRGGGALVEFENNATPSRLFYIDPDHVTAIRHDGWNY